MTTDRRTCVAVIYPFFAHYRAPIMKALLSSQSLNCLLVGDTRDPDGSIEPWLPPKESFCVAPCRKLTSKLLWQANAITVACRRDIAVLIMLGNANILSVWIAAMVGRLLGKRVLFWTHGWLRQESGLKRWVRVLFYRLAHGLLLYGRRARSIGKDNGFPENGLHVVFNSLDYHRQVAARQQVSPEQIRELRKQLFSESTSPVLICTSRLTPFRGLDLLLKAMVRLERAGNRLHLILVGDGPERVRLSKMARELNLSVHFHGACYDEERLAELFMASDLTVVPGKAGLTVMHSLVYGTPVVTQDCPDEQGPEVEAIIPGETGDFFRPGDEVDLARVIIKWTGNDIVYSRIREMSHAVIDRFYNPEYQALVISRAASGLPAHDPELERRVSRGYNGESHASSITIHPQR
jgi:glycosyltransferase involved in cell wall biosynthesis